MTAIWEGELVAQARHDSELEIEGLPVRVQINVTRSEVEVQVITPDGRNGPSLYLLNVEGQPRLCIYDDPDTPQAIREYTNMANVDALQSKRELAAQLAGLRLLQRAFENVRIKWGSADDFVRELLMREIVGEDPVKAVLTDDGRLVPLTLQQIDELCELLNTEVDE